MSDYFNKYLKYKNKYFELKNKFKNKLKMKGGSDNTTANEYRIKLEQLYPSVVFDNKKQDLSDNNDKSKNNTTYGEMNYDGINIINKKFNSTNQFNTFIDIGSGRGKLVLWYAVEPNITKSIGIEIVKQRHLDAIDLKNKLEYPKVTLNVEFINKDFMDIDFSSILNPNSKVIIWMSNLCFNKDITDNIFVKLVKEFPKGTIICCSKETTNPNVKLIETINVPMSWTSSSSVHVYQI